MQENYYPLTFAIIMITIVAGTNRRNSRSLHVAKVYHDMLQEMGVEAQIFSLTQMKSLERDEAFLELEKKYILSADKFIFIVPEYNGSFPGILKLVFDISDIRNCWYFKKALLTGLADGRAGNLRGLDNLTNILHYLRMNVFYNKIPLSRINQELDTEGNMILSETKDNVYQQLKDFVDF